MGGEAEGKMQGQFFHIKLRIIINSNASKWNCKSMCHTSLSMGVSPLTSCGLLLGSPKNSL